MSIAYPPDMQDRPPPYQTPGNANTGRRYFIAPRPTEGRAPSRQQTEENPPRAVAWSSLRTRRHRRGKHGLPARTHWSYFLPIDSGEGRSRAFVADHLRPRRKLLLPFHCPLCFAEHNTYAGINNVDRPCNPRGPALLRDSPSDHLATARARELL